MYNVSVYGSCDTCEQGLGFWEGSGEGGKAISMDWPQPFQLSHLRGAQSPQSTDGTAAQPRRSLPCIPTFVRASSRSAGWRQIRAPTRTHARIPPAHAAVVALPRRTGIVLAGLPRTRIPRRPRALHAPPLRGRDQTLRHGGHRRARRLSLDCEIRGRGSRGRDARARIFCLCAASASDFSHSVGRGQPTGSTPQCPNALNCRRACHSTMRLTVNVTAKT